MKSFTIFESTIIGLFVGVVVSTYITYIDSIGGYLGQILSWVSLHPLLAILISPQNQSIVVKFLSMVAVYTIYGLIAGLILRKSSKAKFIIPIVIILLVIAAAIQQNDGSAQASVTPEVSYSKIEISSKSRSKAPEQYFGNEAVGDLNDDGNNDVAFIISRNDSDRGTLYYLVTALAEENGHSGTNLIYLGEKLEIQGISIDHGIIAVSYLDHIDNRPKIVYARVQKGTLESIAVADKGYSLAWGEIVKSQDVQTFKSCDNSDILQLMASSSVMKSIDAAESGMTNTHEATSTLLGALIGRVSGASASTTNDGNKLQLWSKEIVTLMPNHRCP